MIQSELKKIVECVSFVQFLFTNKRHIFEEKHQNWYFTHQRTSYKDKKGKK